MEHSLTLGSLLLTDSIPDVDQGFVFNVLSEGASFGVARGAQEVVRSLLADGDLVRVTRFGNREVTFAVEITGPSLAALAHGEAALRREVGRVNELTWQAPDIIAVPTVFEVVTSEMTQKFDDLAELRRRRTFEVSLTCAPFARSATPVTVSAISTAPTPMTVSMTTADTTTGFSASASVLGSQFPVAVTDQGNFVQATVSGSRPSLLHAFGLTTPLSMASTRYLVVEASGTPVAYFEVNVNGTNARTSPILTRATSTGTILYVFDTAGGNLSSFGLLTDGASTRATTATINIHDVYRTDTLPQVTKRQLTRTIQTGGTERTPASLHVYSEYDLGNMQVAIIHTCPEDNSGYSPPLRRWRVAGNTEVAAEGDTLSLKREALKPNSVTCEVPNPALPTGGYVFAARLQSSVMSQVGIDWAVHTFFSADGGPEEGVVSGTMPWTPKGVSQWEIVPLAMLTLPTVWGVGGMTRVSIRCLAADADVFWDEAFLFRVDDDCALTILSEPPDNIWLDSAGVAASSPRVQQGYSFDRTDARHPGSRLLASGNHVLHPEGTTVFSAAITNQLMVDATYYRRWHSNAAE